MKKFYVLFACLLAATMGVFAQQLPDSGFEDWSDEYNGDAQLKNWHGSNVTQVGLKFTFMYKKDGRTGACAYVADREVGAMGITEVGPGYMGLGTAWQYLDGLNVSSATAGLSGGISWKYRPDTMSVWIKRTGDNTDKEDFHLLYYSWSGTAKGSKYKCKSGSCTSVSQTNEESDVRQALDGNECGTDTKANQIAEGWYRARAKYDKWTQIKVPIYYMNGDIPSMCNVIFSAGNYPNFRANSGLYVNNGLYVDDLELIYSSKIQTLYIDNKEWKAFDPDSEEEQTYSLGEKATALPAIEAWRGAGSLTNVKGTTATFSGRKLSGSEITITNGVIDGAPTTITVKSEDGKSTTTYKIKFVRAASTNANLAGITVNGESLVGFKGTTTSYNVELPYGTTAAPVVDAVLAEDAQTVSITQATSVTGTATINVTAADKKTKKTYTLKFSVAQLKDNTLQNILVNGSELAGFVPSQTIYKVALPLGTTTMPTIEAVSAYPKGAQTIVYTAPEKIDGGTYQISVTTPGNQTPKVYKLNFKIEASTYSKLKDLKMGDYIADFDPDNLTYYVNLPIGTTELPEITYVKGDPYQKDVEIQYGGLDGITRVIVTAASGDQTIYKIIVATAKSDISTLKNVFINGTPLSGFSPSTLKYTYNLEVGTTTIPTITVEQGDEFQTYTITYGGLNEVTRVTVQAGDGSTTIYQITFAVERSENCKLADIQVNGKSIEGFQPETLEYYYTLAKEEAIPTVTYTKAEASQTVNERKITTVPGDYKLTVVAESGAKQTYIIHFVLNLSSNANLAGIKLDGVPMEGFSPETYAYIIDLPAGESTLPEVDFVKGESGQKVIVSESDNTYSLQVTAENGYTVNTYTVQFNIQISTNAYLEMIMVGGVNIPGFDKEVMNYQWVLTSAEVPAITVVKADNGQQVSIAMPVGIGIAVIRVAPESGAPNTYRIEFVKPASDAILLNSILKDGVQIDGWEPSKENYNVNYTDALPVITYEQKDGQRVVQLDAKDEEGNPVTYIHVTAGGDTKTYTISYTKTASKNTQLAGIWIDGKLIEEPFNPEKYDYSLPVSDHLPTITYQKKEDSQIAIYGQKEEGLYQIVVLSAGRQDTATYTIAVAQHELYNNTILEKVMLDGKEITFSKSNTYEGGDIPEGNALPEITYVKDPGQTVLVTDVSTNKQQILVVAESGASETYTINYNITKGTDSSLSGILIDGTPLKDFAPKVKSYTVLLDERTTEVPAVTPLSNVIGQVYTINYGRVNSPTTIEVRAKDGVSKSVYTIQFNVRPLTNTQLAKLELSDFTNLMDDPDVLEYTHVISSEQIPTVEFTRGEEEQKIEYTRGRDGETWVKVIAQSGDSRTYHVKFVKEQPVAANVLKSLTVNNQKVTLADTIRVELPFGSTDIDIKYETNFSGQTVLLNNGGVANPSQLIVMANHPDVADKVYTIIPSLPRFNNEGKLKTLKFRGKNIENFQPDVYNYVVNTTTKPTAANFRGTTFDGQQISVTDEQVDHVKKQVILEVPGGEKYCISWFYENDNTYLKDENRYSYFDFSADWVPTDSAAMWYSSLTTDARKTDEKKSTGFKPSSKWTVPADLAAGLEFDIDASSITFGLLGKIVDLFWYSGKEVIAVGTNGSMLSTINGASINGSVPGMMTIGGTMSLTPNKSGNSKSSVQYNTTKFIQFRNTPDSLSMSYKSLAASHVSGWYYELVTNPASASPMKFNGKYYNDSKWRYASLPITTTGERKSYALTINSAHTDNAGDMTGSDVIYTSDLQVENIHFVYNSNIIAATVDGNSATIEGDSILYTITDEEYTKFPEVKVEGQVEDQEQLFTWEDEVLEGENMVRRAVLRNFGEDHSFTDYHVAIRRPAVKDVTLQSLRWGDTELFAPDKTDFVVIRNNMLDLVPDIKVIPNSAHQKVDISHKDNVFTITVTPEIGNARTYTLTFKEKETDVATLASVKDINLTEPFEKTKFDYILAEGSSIPVFDFTKDNDYQSAVFTHTPERATIVVTSADGKKTNTYTFSVPEKETAATLKVIKLDGTLQPLAARMEVKTMPQVVLFERTAPTDSVVQVIASDSIEWVVYGTNNKQNNYKLVNITDLNSDAHLAGVLVNGEYYEPFNPLDNETVIPTDTMVTLEFLALNAEQTITMSLETKPHTTVRRATNIQDFVFKVVVLAADKQTEIVYTFTLEAPKSSDATLQAIVINGDTIKNPSLTEKYAMPLIDGPKTKESAMPKIQYIPSDPQAAVEVVPAGFNEENYILVTPSDGSSLKQYSLTIESYKSAYARLNGIMIDGTPLQDFDENRFFYSVQVEPGKHEIITSSLDKFQQPVVPEFVGNNIILNVIAEDGIHSERYLVELYEASKSNNATLSGIKVGGELLPAFDPMNNHYTYDIEAGVKIVPDVEGVMSVNGQTVEVDKRLNESGLTEIILNVTAPNNIDKNTYTITFNRPMSSDISLKMILLDGDSLAGFEPEQKIYQIALPVGKLNELPTIYAQRNTTLQKMPEIITSDLKAEIIVTAEDGSQGVYTLLFTNTYSSADSLLAIYADNKLIDGFTPKNFYYALTLPVEAAGFPELTWDEADEWQKIKLDTLQLDSLAMMCQIEVIAQNEHKNLYTISYQRELWAVDTIQMIYVDNKPLENFSASQFDYSVILPAGTTELPTVSYDTNEKFKQRITLAESVDSIATKSLNKKIDVIVEAENGKSRTYTIHFPIELSSETALNIIQYGGQPLAGFDAERTSYKVQLPLGTKDVPVITVSKKEETQKVDINTKGWTVTIDVTAEDGIHSKQYTIEFELAKSSNALLSELIYVFPDHNDTITVMPEVFEYSLQLPLGIDTLPEVMVTKSDSLQQVNILPASANPDGTFLSTVMVTAPDEETQLEYQITFSFSRNNDARLTMIYLDTLQLEGFNADSLEYNIVFPSGTSEAEYYTLDRVSYTLSDALASDTIWQDAEYAIFIEVTAQDGSRNMYTLHQSTALSEENRLADILLDSVSLREFDPEIDFYTYYIVPGISITPSITAIPMAEEADIAIKPGEAIGDTTLIFVTAENGDTRTYYIWFTYTNIDDAQQPQAEDVLVKRIYGTQDIFVAAIRSNVAFALYDRNGRVIEYIQPLPVCNPNDAIMNVNANGQEYLADVVGESSGVRITLNPNTIYFYGFYENEKRRITSGKLVIVNDHITQ